MSPLCVGTYLGLPSVGNSFERGNQDDAKSGVGASALSVLSQRSVSARHLVAEDTDDGGDER
jgi:hypothetical protein